MHQAANNRFGLGLLFSKLASFFATSPLTGMLGQLCNPHLFLYHTVPRCAYCTGSSTRSSRGRVKLLLQLRRRQCHCLWRRSWHTSSHRANFAQTPRPVANSGLPPINGIKTKAKAPVQCVRTLHLQARQELAKCRRAAVIDKLGSFWKGLHTALSQYSTQRPWLHCRHAVLSRVKPCGCFSTISRQIVKWHVAVDSTDKELRRPWQPHCSAPHNNPLNASNIMQFRSIQCVRCAVQPC
jgi:hypothetical protein